MNLFYLLSLHHRIFVHVFFFKGRRWRFRKAESIESIERRTLEAEMMMAQKAFRTTTDFEETMRSAEVQFFIGVEWDIDDTGLLDLQKNHLADAKRGSAVLHRGGMGHR